MQNPRCYAGHSLKCTSDCENWWCNNCKKKYYGPRFGCHDFECSYDVCHKCIGHVTNIVCPSHHLLMTISYGGEWICDNHPQYPTFQGGTYLGCNQEGCDYGLCSKCTPSPILMPIHHRVSRMKILAARLGRLSKYSVSVALSLVGIVYSPT
jgi:hypothetical protein